MKYIDRDFIKKTLKDSWWVGLVVSNSLLVAISIIIISLRIQPHEAQVFVRYSSFGEVGLYKSYWHHLWSYVLLSVIILVAHVVISLKLQHLNKRDLSLALLWGTLGMTIMLLIFAVAILGVATLG